MIDLISKIERMFAGGLKISTVYIEPEPSGRYVVVVGVANWLPLGEGGGLPHHIVEIDRSNLPDGVTIQGGERHPDERIALGPMSEEIAEALIRDVARAGGAKDVAGFERPGFHGKAWLTKPRKWGVS